MTRSFFLDKTSRKLNLPKNIPRPVYSWSRNYVIEITRRSAPFRADSLARELNATQVNPLFRSIVYVHDARVKSLSTRR